MHFHPVGMPPMLITSRSKSWSEIIMSGDVALTLLKMMGHSGAVPGALRSRSIPAALAQLKQALGRAGPAAEAVINPSPGTDNADTAPLAALMQRSYPLIQLLSAAAQQECDVTWDKDHPTVYTSTPAIAVNRLSGKQSGCSPNEGSVSRRTDRD